MSADTKQMIANTLFELLEHRGIDSVTVKDLVDVCRISRQTFYYHFRDIMDVLEWGAGRMLEQDLRTLPQFQSPREALGQFVGRIVRRRSAVLRLLESHRQTEFLELLLRTLRAYLRELFRRQFPSSRLSAADAGALLDCYTYGILGLILQCCKQAQPDEEQLADQIYRLLSGEMLSQLR